MDGLSKSDEALIAAAGEADVNANGARPPSATHPVVALAGAGAFLTSLTVLVVWRPFGEIVPSAFFVIGTTTVAIFALDLGWQRVYRRASTGLDFAFDDPDWPRTLVKWLGLLASLGLLGVGYWVFPEYHGDLFADYLHALSIASVPLLALAIPYFFFVDRHMRVPRDGYWQMGQVVLGNWAQVDRTILGQHLLAWLIKGFFLALMFGLLCADLRWLLLFDFGGITSFGAWYQFMYRFVFLVDVGIATVGYAMAFRLTDTHIRSSEPTLLGWVVALACYEPFWSLVSRHYLPYDTGYLWSAWLSPHPMLYIGWGIGIVMLSFVYVWATIIFGARFSNLTHRGIITSGPYRFTKHPAYLAKNLTYWMIALPFLPRNDLWDTLPRCAMLVGLNLIYYLRAKTEERHLSRDPEYVRYARWIEQHGPLRFLRNIPFLGRAVAAHRKRAMPTL